jgi:hypothetical protein
MQCVGEKGGGRLMQLRTHGRKHDMAYELGPSGGGVLAAGHGLESHVVYIFCLNELMAPNLLRLQLY